MNHRIEEYAVIHGFLFDFRQTVYQESDSVALPNISGSSAPHV
jgi:hypothetical protein